MLSVIRIIQDHYKTFRSNSAFKLLAIGVLILIGCGKKNEAVDISGNADLDNYLLSLEALDAKNLDPTSNFIEGDKRTAKKCIKVTYSNGGTAKYCGPNTDKILAKCPQRGWKCTAVNAHKSVNAILLTSSSEFEKYDAELRLFIRPSNENVYVAIPLGETEGEAGICIAEDSDDDLWCEEYMAAHCTGCIQEPGEVSCTDCNFDD